MHFGNIVCYNRDTLTNLKKILETANDHKAICLKLLDVGSSCSYADHLVIMSASSDRHARSLADSIAESVNGKTEDFEGYQGGQWIIMDFGDTVVHVFLEDARAYYNFDKLWGDVPAQNYPSESKAGGQKIQLPA